MYAPLYVFGIWILRIYYLREGEFGSFFKLKPERICKFNVKLDSLFICQKPCGFKADHGWYVKIKTVLILRIILH